MRRQPRRRAQARRDGRRQFIYKTRKKALGPFKRQLWELPTKDEILADQEKKLVFLLEQLRVGGSRQMVERYIKPPQRSRPAPDVLAEMGVAKA